MMGRWHWFQIVSICVLVLFLAVLVSATIFASMRRSGSTGLDVATVQKMRYDALFVPPPVQSP